MIIRLINKFIKYKSINLCLGLNNTANPIIINSAEKIEYFTEEVITPPESSLRYICDLDVTSKKNTIISELNKNNFQILFFRLSSNIIEITSFNIAFK